MIVDCCIKYRALYVNNHQILWAMIYILSWTTKKHQKNSFRASTFKVEENQGLFSQRKTNSRTFQGLSLKFKDFSRLCEPCVRKCHWPLLYAHTRTVKVEVILKQNLLPSCAFSFWLNCFPFLVLKEEITQCNHLNGFHVHWPHTSGTDPDVGRAKVLFSHLSTYAPLTPSLVKHSLKAAYYTFLMIWDNYVTLKFSWIV